MGDNSRRSRGCDVDHPWETSRGGAAAATWIFRGDGDAAAGLRLDRRALRYLRTVPLDVGDGSLGATRLRPGDTLVAIFTLANTVSGRATEPDWFAQQYLRRADKYR